MKTASLNRIALGAFLFGILLAVVFGVRLVAFNAAMDQLGARGTRDLALATDRLSAELHRYRELAVLLSNHPSLEALVHGGGDVARATKILVQKADQTGSLEIRLVRNDATVLASAGRGASTVGSQPAFSRAMQGALGSAHYVNSDGQRVFTFAAPVFGPNGPAAGAVLVTIDLSEIERNWPSGPTAVFFTDANGVVYVTSRSELVLASYDGRSGRPFPTVRRVRLHSHDVWRINGGPYLPDEAIYLARSMPIIAMKGEILINTAPAHRIANLQAAVAGSLVLLIGLMFILAGERRRALAVRLKAEAAANTALEARVLERTGTLSKTNAVLRREISERHDAERALRKAQSDLVRASKLSALGQMSAGISHELNQPLMAIRSYSENAEAYLKRDDQPAARKNLARISEMTQRMGRIIQNLRAFARQEPKEIGDVDVVAAVNAALELVHKRLANAGITVDWQRPKTPILVRGGDVRLQQILTNLILNSADAMESSAKKHLSIRIETRAQTALVTVADSGPGIDDPDKIFDPFYTTKTTGKSEGMGLGLSISYGLVQSFGGKIQGRNLPTGGAEFTVELSRAVSERAP